jgi:hypothetical protein
MITREQTIKGIKLLYITSLLSLVVYSCHPVPVGADYLLEVSHKQTNRYTFGQRRFISFYDCRDTRSWLLGVLDALGTEAYVTCTPITPEYGFEKE